MRNVVQARKVLELLPYKAQQANQLVLFTKLNSLALLTVPLLLKPLILEKLSVALWEIELANRPVNYGLLYQRFISNVPLPIQIFGKLTKQLFLMNVIELLVKKQV